jgi:hypothetical protein
MLVAPGLMPGTIRLWRTIHIVSRIVSSTILVHARGVRKQMVCSNFREIEHTVFLCLSHSSVFSLCSGRCHDTFV